MRHRPLILRFNLVIVFLFLTFPSMMGDEKVAEIKSVSSKVAVMAYHVPHEPSFYQDTRRIIYERLGLRILRFIHRRTGIALDKDSSTFFYIAYTLLAILSVCFFFGFMKKQYRFKLYSLGFLLILKFLFTIYIYSGVASLNQFDMRDPLKVQHFVDILNGQAIEYDVIDDWKTFKKNWEADLKKGHLPYATIAWIGVPHGVEPIHIHNWINDHRHLPIFHAALGAHLSQVFHRVVFQGKMPELKWDPGSPVSITEKDAAYARHISWRVEGDQSQLGVYRYGKGKVLYATTEVDPLSLSNAFVETMQETSPAGLIRLHNEGIAALRLDDPGTAQNHYAEPWAFNAMSGKDWLQVADILQKYQSKMSVGIVTGWVDHGEEKLGSLWVSGNLVKNRVAGKVYESRYVRYEDHVLKSWNNIGEQFSVLQSRPEFDLQLHGHTHITPNLQAWLKAKDRFEDFKWYREFLVTETFPFAQRDAKVQYKTIEDGLDKFKKAFPKEPRVLIPPGHKVSYDTAVLAGALGLTMMSDGSCVLMRREQHRRSRLVVTYNMWDDVHPADYIAANYPMTYLLHDRDIVVKGLAWFEKHLKQIKSRGVVKVTSLNELMLRLHGIAHAFVDLKEEKYRLSFDIEAKLADAMGKTFEKGLALRIKPPKGKTFAALPQGVRHETTLPNGEWLLRFPGLNASQLAFDFTLKAI